MKQGGILVVQGGVVDRFGDDVLTDDTGYGLPKVTSSVASDVIVPDPDFGVLGLINVMFPHASTHNLTVAAGKFSTSFAVDVQPSATTIVTPAAPTPAAAPIAPTNTSEQLAFTGTDAAGALPWALGLLVAGAGLNGTRTLRRRLVQR